MEATQILNHVYKQEVANAIEQKVLFQVQYEIAKEEIKQKDQRIETLQNEIVDLTKEVTELKDNIESPKEVIE